MNVVIFSGIPGSGKTTLSKKLYPTASFYSADHYFQDKCPKCWVSSPEHPGGVPIDPNCTICNGKGEFYNFKPGEIGTAHGWCLRNYVSVVAQFGKDNRTLVVDNTNTTAAEVAPYAALALAYSHNLQVITVECPVAVAMTRQAHGVPQEVLERMHLQILGRTLPKYWPNTGICTTKEIP